MYPASQVKPKIALIFDPNHLDTKEKEITHILSHLEPLKNIIFFKESRFVEIPALNQYSVELNDENNDMTTANPCILLIARILIRNNSKYIKIILGTIYADPYLKVLFTERKYITYNPENYGIKNASCNDLINQSQQSLAVRKIEELFYLLDCELTQKAPTEQEKFFDDCITDASSTILQTNCDIDIKMIAAIAEALAFLKIEHVQKNLDPRKDNSNELTVSYIHRLYSENSSSLLIDLNINFRTRFQVKKVIRVIERTLTKQSKNKEKIFVVRLGQLHEDIMTNMLTQHFNNGDIKEVRLSVNDLSNIEQQIKNEFELSKNLYFSFFEISLNNLVKKGKSLFKDKK